MVEAQSFNRRRIQWSLFSILIVGFFLRVWGISFGLPYLYHADEPIVVNHAVAYGTWDFNPHFFKIPPLVSYLVFLCYGIFYWAGRALGIFSGITDFEVLFLTNPTFFYVLARVLFGAMLGTASIIALFYLIRRHFSERRAMITAFLFAVSFLHVRDSHYIYPDIPLLFILVLSFFPILSVCHGKSGWKGHILSGICIGLATAIKYNGIMLIVPYLSAVFLSPSRRREWIFLVGAGIAVLVTYSIGNPYTWLDFTTFWHEISRQAEAEGQVGLLHHGVYSLNGAIGPLLLVAALWGMFKIVFKPETKRIVFFSFLISYYVVLSVKSQPYDRYVLPMIPLLLFFSADAIMGVAQQFSRVIKGKILWGFIGILAVPTLTKAVLSDTLFMRKDVRTIAKEWVEKSIPSGARLALDWDFFMPRLGFSTAQLEHKHQMAKSRAHFSGAQEKRLNYLLSESDELSPRYNLYFLSNKTDNQRFLFGTPTVSFNISELKKLGIQYVFIARVRPSYQQHHEFYEDLQEQGTLIKRFSPYRDSQILHPFDSQPLTGGPFLWKELVARERNGQPIEVYRLK